MNHDLVARRKADDALSMIRRLQDQVDNFTIPDKKPKIEPMNNEIAVISPAFSISGEVRVPLAELDKLRSDYATTIRRVAELEEHQMQVKVIMVENKGVWDAGNRYEPGRYVEKLTQVGQEYRNLDDVRVLIRKEEEEKIWKEKTDIRNTLKLREESLSVLTAKHNALIREKEKVDLEFKELNKLLDDEKKFGNNQTEALAQSTKDITGVRKEMVRLARLYDDTRKAKSFWFWLNAQFRLKP